MIPPGAPQPGSGSSDPKAGRGPDAPGDRGAAGRGQSLRAAFGWVLLLGLTVLLAIGILNGLRAVGANGYLSQDLPNAALYTFQSALNQHVWVIAALVAVLFLAAASCLVGRRAGRTAAVYVGLAAAAVTAYVLGYDLNRWQFKGHWLGTEPFLNARFLLTNLGVLLATLVAAWVVYRLVRFLIRKMGLKRERIRPVVPLERLALVFLVLLVAFNVFCRVHRARVAPSGPNVVLISLDTLRADHLGCYGYDGDVSPAIDRLAESAVVFENAITQSGWTLPSHKVVLTSLYPQSLRKGQNRRIAHSRTTLTEILLDRGYATGAFAHGLGWVTSDFNFDQGFGTYVVPSRKFIPEVASAETITREGLAWVRNNRTGRFFLFLHYGDIHSDTSGLPYDVPAPYRTMFVPPGSERFDRSGEEVRATQYLLEIARGNFQPSEEEVAYIRGLYGGGVRYTDEHVGALVAGLAEMGVLDNTILVIFSDHGEEFMEHGRMLHGRVYREVAHVPLIVKLPEGRAGGARVAAQVQLLDVAPTILDALGSSPLPEMQGRSLLPVIGEEGGGRPAYTEGEESNAVRAEGWMYLLNWSDSDRPEMYDQARDPSEQTDLAGHDLPQEQVLGQMLADWVRTAEGAALGSQTAEPLELDSRTEELLKSLGYLGGKD